jgi:hypothetical protein
MVPVPLILLTEHPSNEGEKLISTVTLMRFIRRLVMQKPAGVFHAELEVISREEDKAMPHLVDDGGGWRVGRKARTGIEELQCFRENRTRFNGGDAMQFHETIYNHIVPVLQKLLGRLAWTPDALWHSDF